MNLDDLVYLTRAIVNKVEQTILGGYEDCGSLFRSLFAKCKVDQRLAEDFPSCCIVEGNELTRKVPIFDLKESDVFSPACYKTF